MSGGLRSGSIVRVTAGSPTPEEVAVLLAALDATGERLVVATAVGRSGWAQAARHEALGGRPVAGRGDLLAARSARPPATP